MNSPTRSGECISPVKELASYTISMKMGFISSWQHVETRAYRVSTCELPLHKQDLRKTSISSGS